MLGSQLPLAHSYSRQIGEGCAGMSDVRSEPMLGSCCCGNSEEVELTSSEPGTSDPAALATSGCPMKPASEESASSGKSGCDCRLTPDDADDQLSVDLILGNGAERLSETLGRNQYIAAHTQALGDSAAWRLLSPHRANSPPGAIRSSEPTAARPPGSLIAARWAQGGAQRLLAEISCLLI